MLAVPTVGRQRTHEFEASPGDTARSCFKTTKFSVLPSYGFTAQVFNNWHTAFHTLNLTLGPNMDLHGHTEMSTASKTLELLS